MSTQMDRIEQMLRALCAHLGVRDATQVAGAAGEIVAGDDTRYAGVVSRFEHGWGFIECEAMNRNFFVHYSDIEGTGLRSLEAGEVVSFELAPGKDGRPKAVRVRRHVDGRPLLRRPKLQGLPEVDSEDGDLETNGSDEIVEVTDQSASGRTVPEKE